MKLRPLLVPALILTAAGGLLAFLLLADPPESPGAAVAPASNGADNPDGSGEPKGAAVPLPNQIRDVSPEGVTAPKVHGNLKRISPSERYLELKNPPVEPLPDGPLELRRVQVLDGGNLKSDKLDIKLAYIVPLQPNATCISRLGGSWPCGARARTFLRGLVRQFKVTCNTVQIFGPQKILATCSRGKIDLGARMIRYGWADPTDDAPAELQELALKAKEKKIGKWQSEWLHDLPAHSWENGPDTALPGLESLEPEIIEWSLRTDAEGSGEETDPADLDVFPELPPE